MYRPMQDPLAAAATGGGVHLGRADRARRWRAAAALLRAARRHRLGLRPEGVPAPPRHRSGRRRRARRAHRVRDRPRAHLGRSAPRRLRRRSLVRRRDRGGARARARRAGDPRRRTRPGRVADAAGQPCRGRGPCRYSSGSSFPIAAVRRWKSGRTLLSKRPSRPRRRGRRRLMVPPCIDRRRSLPWPLRYAVGASTAARRWQRARPRSSVTSSSRRRWMNCWTWSRVKASSQLSVPVARGRSAGG